MRHSILPYLLLACLAPFAHAQNFFQPAEQTPTIWITAHLNVVAGESSTELDELSNHEHDPNDEFTVQGLEIDANFKLTENFKGFVNALFFVDEEDAVETEIEEAFLRYDFTDSWSLRGGRLLNRVGIQNDKHLHAWDFVDSNLSTALFLGEEGLVTESGELTWQKRGLSWTTAISASYGEVLPHEEEEEEEEGGPEFEEAFISDDVITSRVMFIYHPNDFHQHTFGFNTAFGDNGYDRDTNIFSFDYAYTWRENGQEEGRFLTTGLEYFYRDVEWVSEADPSVSGSTGQSSYLAYANYGFAKDWILGMRYEYLEGVEGGEVVTGGESEFAFSTERRQRASLALTRWHTFDDDWSAYLRLQYNYDDIAGRGNEDSVFLQLGINLGGGEIR